VARVDHRGGVRGAFAAGVAGWGRGVGGAAAAEAEVRGGRERELAGGLVGLFERGRREIRGGGQGERGGEGVPGSGLGRALAGARKLIAWPFPNILAVGMDVKARSIAEEL
jgi:hypothetical protein